MSRFLTRVELHDASYQDYHNLHSAMEAHGFSRTITASDGQEYSLPTAQYSMVANLTIESVRAHAKTAADSTGREAEVIVTEGQSAWIGLPLATSRYAGR